MHASIWSGSSRSSVMCANALFVAELGLHSVHGAILEFKFAARCHGQERIQSFTNCHQSRIAVVRIVCRVVDAKEMKAAKQALKLLEGLRFQQVAGCNVEVRVVDGFRKAMRQSPTQHEV